MEESVNRKTENIFPDTVTYFFPGMAASDIMFYKYRNLPFECRFFNWIDPQKNEDLSHYAKRYVEMMDPDKKVNLVGVSFGGLLAMEISRHITVNKIVLISSMPHRHFSSWIVKLFRFIRIYNWIPPKRPPLNKRVVKKIFGIQRDADADFFIRMISEYDFRNLRWSLKQLVNWKHNGEIPGLIHIIGDRDHLFRPGSTKKEYVIKGGTHYMVVDRASEVKELLVKALGSDT